MQSLLIAASSGWKGETKTTTSVGSGPSRLQADLRNGMCGLHTSLFTNSSRRRESRDQLPTECETLDEEKCDKEESPVRGDRLTCPRAWMGARALFHLATAGGNVARIRGRRGSRLGGTPAGNRTRRRGGKVKCNYAHRGACVNGESLDVRGGAP